MPSSPVPSTVPSTGGRSLSSGSASSRVPRGWQRPRAERGRGTAGPAVTHCRPPLPAPGTPGRVTASQRSTKSAAHESRLAAPHAPHELDHRAHVLHQRLVPLEDLGPGAPVVGEPVPVLGHQVLHPTGIEHALKRPAGEEDSHSRPPLTSSGHGQGRTDNPDTQESDDNDFRLRWGVAWWGGQAWAPGVHETWPQTLASSLSSCGPLGKAGTLPGPWFRRLRSGSGHRGEHVRWPEGQTT